MPGASVRRLPMARLRLDAVSLIGIEVRRRHSNALRQVISVCFTLESISYNFFFVFFFSGALTWLRTL